MLDVMLCGASDTNVVAGQFSEVVRAFGGEPWHYLSGDILHLNSASASWVVNSKATVQKADLCVFVILERYGDITWAVELESALSIGKPFLLLCLAETYRKYMTLLRSVASPDAIVDESERRLVMKLRELESDQLTIAQFEHGYFKDELRRQMAFLYGQALEVLAQRNQRSRLLAALDDSKSKLTAMDRDLLTALATDEAEEKAARKRALIALSDSGGLQEDDLKALLESMEGGIQRLTLSLLPKLAPSSPADPEFFEFCVQVSNESDDVGLARRLIPVLFAIDVAGALDAVELLDLNEIGSRRRLAAALHDHESDLKRLGLAVQAAALAAKCLASTAEVGWQRRCAELIERLKDASGS